MADPRTMCLIHSNKAGLALKYDPDGSYNRCFYQCIGKALKISTSETIGTLQSFMVHNPVLPVRDEV